jgi:hypothetical protein
MTHQQLVEEWKEKFRKNNLVQVMRDAEDFNPNQYNLMERIAFDVLSDAMLAAAKGAAEAGKVGGMNDTPSITASAWNGAVDQSDHQLENYFREV